LFYDYKYRCSDGGLMQGGYGCQKDAGRWLIGKDYTKFNNPAPFYPMRPPDPSDAAFTLVWSSGRGVDGRAQCPNLAVAADWTVLGIDGNWVEKFPMTIAAFRAGAL
jgi:hypothetical protein